MLQSIKTEIGKRYLVTINYSTTVTEFLYDPYMNIIGTLPSNRNSVEIEFMAIYNDYLLQAGGYGDPMVVSNINLREIPNLVNNGTFDTDIEWTKGANTIISGGKAIISGSGILLTSTTINQLMPPKRYRYYFELGNFTGSIAIWGSVGSGYFTSSGIKTGDFAFGHTGNSSIYFYANQQTTGSIDNFHIYEIPEWVSNGNHAIKWTYLNNYTSSGSLLISSSGVGSSGSNYVSLPYANFDAIESTKKYTLELWAKVDGSNLAYSSSITTGDNYSFDTTSGSWSSQRLEKTVESGSLKGVCNLVDGVEAALTYPVTGNVFSTNKVYKVSFLAKSTNHNRVPRIFNGTAYEYVDGNMPLKTYFQQYNHYFIPTTTTRLFLSIGRNEQGLQIGDDFYIDNVTIQEANLQPTITLQVGSKFVSSSILSPKTFFQNVLNFEAAATEVNQDIKLYLNQSASVYVDNISLSQRYDLGLFAKFKIESGSTGFSTIFSYGGVNGAYTGGFWIYRHNLDRFVSIQLQPYIGNSINSYIYNINTGSTNAVNIVYDSVNLKTNINTATHFAVGNMLGRIYNLTYPVGIGFVPTNHYLSGSISQLQVVRFNNIALSTWNSSSNDLQSPYNGGAEEILRLDFQNPNTTASFYRDNSINKNTIQANNVNLSNLVYINTGYSITSGSDKTQLVNDWDKELIVSQSLNTGSVYRLEFYYKTNGTLNVKNGNYTVATASAITSSYGFYEGTFLCTSPLIYMQASSGSWIEVDKWSIKEIPNLVSNGNFTNGTTGFSVDNASLSTNGPSAYVTATGTGAIFKTVALINPNTLFQNKRYRLNYEVIRTTGGWNGMTLNGYNSLIASSNVTAGTGSKSIDFTYPDSQSQIRWISSASVAGDVLQIDNIHLYELADWKSNGNHTFIQSTQYVYSGSYSGRIQSTGTGSSTAHYVNLAYTEYNTLSQYKKYILEFKAISSVASASLTVGLGTNTKTFTLNSTSTWTNCLWNIDNYDNSFTNQDIKMWLGNSGSVWIDELKVRQNYDIALITSGKFVRNTSYTGSWDLLIFGSETSNSSSVGYGLSYDNNEGLWGDFVDSNNNLVSVSSSISQDYYYDSIILIKNTHRESTTASLYINNTLAGIAYGTLGLMDIPYFESSSVNASQNLKGWLGRTQLIRFDNISASNFKPTSYNFDDVITGGNAEVVAKYTWKDSNRWAENTNDDEFGFKQLFYDKSNVKNDLSVSGLTLNSIQTVPFMLITGSLVINSSSLLTSIQPNKKYKISFNAYASGNNALPMDLTMSLGNVTKSWTNISYNSGSPSILSYNFTASSAITASSVVFNKQTVGIVNMYNVRLHQAYDMTLNIMMHNTLTAPGEYLLYMQYGSGSFAIKSDVDYYSFELYSTTASSSAKLYTSTFGTGSWGSVSFVHKPNVGAEIFVNGISILTDTTTKDLNYLNDIQLFLIGNNTDSGDFTNAFIGNIGEMQLIQGYAYNSDDSLYLYENGFIYPQTGKIAFWYKFIEGSLEDIYGNNELTPMPAWNSNYGSYESINNVKLRELFAQNYGVYYDFNNGYPYLYDNEYKFYTRNSIYPHQTGKIIKIGRIFNIEWNSYY